MWHISTPPSLRSRLRELLVAEEELWLANALGSLAPVCLPAPLSSVSLTHPSSAAPSLQSAAKPEKFQRWRAVEIKHGRIAMMATLGYIAQETVDFPGYLSISQNIKFSDVPNGIKGLAMVPPAGLAQILLFIGVMEVATWRFYEGPYPGTVPAGKAPGDVAGELWVRYSDPEEKKTKLNIELNNGRAAMMGSLGMIMHDHLTGSWIPPGF